MVVVLCLVPLAWLLGTFPSAAARRPRPRPRRPEGGLGQPRRVERRRGCSAGRPGSSCCSPTSRKGALAAGVGLALGGRRGAFAPRRRRRRRPHVPDPYRKGGKGVATAARRARRAVPARSSSGSRSCGSSSRAVLHKASLASLACAVAVPGRGRRAPGYDSWEHRGRVGARGCLVIARHLGNIRRSVRGARRSISARSADGARYRRGVRSADADPSHARR